MAHIHHPDLPRWDCPYEPVATAMESTRQVLAWHRESLERARRRRARTLAHWRQLVSADRCRLARLAAVARAEAGSATAWNRLCWLRLAREHQDELAHATRRLAWMERRAAGLSDGRPLAPSTRRDYARELRESGDILRQAYDAVQARAPLPYYAWCRERDAWLRRQLAPLRIAP